MPLKVEKLGLRIGKERDRRRKLTDSVDMILTSPQRELKIYYIPCFKIAPDKTFFLGRYKYTWLTKKSSIRANLGHFRGFRQKSGLKNIEKLRQKLRSKLKGKIEKEIEKESVV
ncbi:MAG: hypothetical protein KatS3mg096_785 [Candidatus Parcubacteria bacterium]|nr:MAG: hypothetical protein KatS3mg096_785 [Candidatus Parcubacteria bacterium]